MGSICKNCLKHVVAHGSGRIKAGFLEDVPLEVESKGEKGIPDSGDEWDRI